MKKKSHLTARPSHYNKEAEHYDLFNEEHSKTINQTIEKFLKKYKVKSVLDMTCGTGSQVFWLAARGFEVTGSDINSKMLSIAKRKAAREQLELTFIKGDMRTLKVGKFDAVLTIFNAVGHLTKEDFESAMRNIHANLKEGGLYAFDIFNLAYFLKDENITKLTIDWLKKVGKKEIREIQYSTIDEEGILASYTTSIEKLAAGGQKIRKSAQTLQVYTAKQLKRMLSKAGFEILNQCAIDGSRFNETKTERILIFAKKLS